MKVFEDAAKAERRKEREAKKEAKKKAKERAAARGNLEDGEEAENSDEEEDEEEAEAEEAEEEQSTFEIPADKLVFQGNAADRQAVLAHRKWVEVETARLSRARYVWEKERRKKQMEETATRNAGRLAREREEVGHEKKMDSFDRELARIAIRAQHLGLDRNLSRYWWGLASQRVDVFVETEEGRWGKFASLDDLTEFVQALDSGGVRERALVGEIRLPRRPDGVRASSGQPRRARKGLAGGIRGPLLYHPELHEARGDGGRQSEGRDREGRRRRPDAHLLPHRPRRLRRLGRPKRDRCPLLRRERPDLCSDGCAEPWGRTPAPGQGCRI